MRRLSLAVCAALCALPAFAADTIQFAPVSEEVVGERLRTVAKKPAQRRDALRKLFESAGCIEPSLAEQPVKHERLGNLICTLSGSTDSRIVVSAHYDHHAAGSGVVDNWTGASLLASLYESLRSHARKHTFVFIGFTAEETGLNGSRFFVKNLTEEDAAAIKAAVNLDSLGLSPTKAWVSRSNPVLLNCLVGVARTMKLPVSGVNVEEVGNSDGQSFRDRKIPTIDIHSVTQETLPLLHASGDKLTAVRMDDLYSTYRLVAAYLAYLDEKLN
jgi:putative aminopeptidase FrvX